MKRADGSRLREARVTESEGKRAMTSAAHGEEEQTDTGRGRSQLQGPHLVLQIVRKNANGTVLSIERKDFAR